LIAVSSMPMRQASSPRLGLLGSVSSDIVVRARGGVALFTVLSLPPARVP
jgi:hypothetical protein